MVLRTSTEVVLNSVNVFVLFCFSGPDTAHWLKNTKFHFIHYEGKEEGEGERSNIH